MKEFTDNQLKEELCLREQARSDAWYNDPENLCGHCKAKYGSGCNCDDEDYYPTVPKPKSFSPCSGDCVYLEYRTSHGLIGHPSVWVIENACRYCGKIKDMWLLEKNPDKPHYYVPEIKSRQIITNFKKVDDYKEINPYFNLY